MKHRLVLGLTNVFLALQVVAASEARASNPQLPPPPDPVPYVEPKPGSFGDLRIGLSYGAGGYSTDMHGSGSVRNAAAVYFEFLYTTGLPNFVWLFGLDASAATSDVAHANSTLYWFCPYLGIGFGMPVNYNIHVEVTPQIEFVSASVDRPFSAAVAWGDGFGGGVRGMLAYTFDSGLQLGVAGGYSIRLFNLTADCSTCVMPKYNDHALVQVGRASLSIGKRF